MTRKEKGQDQPQGLLALYLTLYNLLQAVGWYWVVGRIVSHLVAGHSHEQVWSIVYPVVVGVLPGGWVRGGVVPTLIQVFGRNHLLIAALAPIEEVHTHWLVTALFLVWGSIELVRYPFYVLSLWGKCPYFLEWLRYTLFIPLYPVGVFIETALYYVLLPYINTYELYRLALPNRWNFAFDYAYFIVIFVLLAIVVFPQNYAYMLAQRRRKIGSVDNKSKRT